MKPTAQNTDHSLTPNRISLHPAARMTLVGCLCFWVLVWVVVPESLLAQFDHENISLVSRWARGPYWSVASQGSLVFYGTGASFLIIDYENPQQPQEVGELILPSLVKGIAIEGDFAYLVVWNYGMYVVYIADPTDPIIVGSVAGEVDGRIAFYSDYTYVLNEEFGIWIYDVSNRNEPEYIRRWESAGIVTDICIVDTIGYLLDNGLGIQYLNLTEPGNPTDAGVYQIDAGARTGLKSIEISEGYALIGGWYGLRIWDISSPDDSTQHHWHRLGGSNGEDIAIRDHYAFVGDSHNGLWVINWQDWDNLTTYFSPDTSIDKARCIAVQNDLVFLAGSGSQTFDITDMENIQLLNIDDTNGYNNSVEVNDDYAYYNSGTRFVILDITDIANPSPLSWIELDRRGSRFTEVRLVDEEYAYVVGGSQLNIIDVTDPRDPILVSEFYTGSFPEDFCLRDTVGFILKDDELISIDLSDPTNPREISRIVTGRWEIKLYGDYAYIIGSTVYVYIYDISDPANMQRIGSLRMPARCQSIVIKDHYAYIGCLGGIVVWDISNIENPDTVGYYYEEGFGSGSLSISGNYLYASRSRNGLHVLDISDVENPEYAGFHRTGNSALDAASKDEYIFIADYADGIYIFRNDLMMDVLKNADNSAPYIYGLISNYPNPFNAVTNIRFGLPEVGYVNVSVYDVSGRIVETLINMELIAGHHVAVWNAEEVAPGMYLIYLWMEDVNFTRKAVILK